MLQTITITAYLLGLTLLVAALRARVGKEPRCPRCNHELTGLPLEPHHNPRCTECGRNIRHHAKTNKPITRTGRRTTNKPKLTAAITILCFAATLTATTKYRVHILSIAPTTAVLTAAQLGSNEAAYELIARLPPISSSATTKTTTLTPAQISKAIDATIAAQLSHARKSPDTPWHNNWAQLAMRLTLLPDRWSGEQISEFYNRAVLLRIDTHQRVRHNEVLPIKLRVRPSNTAPALISGFSPLAGSTRSMDLPPIYASEASMTIETPVGLQLQQYQLTQPNPQTLTDLRILGNYFTQNRDGYALSCDVPASALITDDEARGEHAITVTFSKRVTFYPGHNRKGEQAPRYAQGHSIRTVPLRINIVADDEPIYTPITSADADELLSSMTVSSAKINIAHARYKSITFELKAARSAAPRTTAVLGTVYAVFENDNVFKLDDVALTWLLTPGRFNMYDFYHLGQHPRSVTTIAHVREQTKLREIYNRVRAVEKTAESHTQVFDGDPNLILEHIYASLDVSQLLTVDLYFIPDPNPARVITSEIPSIIDSYLSEPVVFKDVKLTTRPSLREAPPVSPRALKTDEERQTLQRILEEQARDSNTNSNIQLPAPR